MTIRQRLQSLTTAFFTLLTLASAAWAQRDLKDIPVPDPEVERRTFQLADGFEVNLFAADPAIAKPIQMNFDPQGRLWIVSSEVYPHIKPGQTANDKVLILEDLNGDGQSDKTTVFADGLLIPTGIEPGDGGAYVANSTELLHLSDTTGDGRADTERVVLSGFGTEDTHHILHTLRWGPDGMLYFNQSIYIHSHIETPFGVRRLNGGGIWQFRPETMQLEVFARGFINTWGHDFDQWGQSFATDGAGGEGINYVVPGAAYATAVGVPRILQGLNPGSPKFCGLEIVGGRHLPDDWQGNAITCDFRGHRVCRFVLSDDGSGYAAREQVELIKSDHVAFRPIDVKMGPDGAIYIADWYNPIIQHGEVDFRDPRRDQTHGRIWRITYKGRPLVERPNLVDAPTADLLEHLKSPEVWTRHQARRVLKERAAGLGAPDASTSEDFPAAEVRPALDAWTAALDPSEPQFEQHALEALWTYQALDLVEPQLLERLLRADDGRVRAAATRVVKHWQDRLPDSLNRLGKLVADDHPRVRLEAVRALGAADDPQAIATAMQALDHSLDVFLDYALWLTARELKSLWLPLVEAGQLNFGGNTRHLTFALKSVDSATVVPSLMKLLQENNLTGDEKPQVLELIVALGGPRELGAVFDLAMWGTSDTKLRAMLLTALADAAQRRSVAPAGDLDAVVPLLRANMGDLPSIAARCAGLWKLETAREDLNRLAQSADAEPKLRQAAIIALADLGGDAGRNVLMDLAREDESPEVRRDSLLALTTLDLNAAAEIAVAVLMAEDDGSRAAPLFAAFLGQRDGAKVLAMSLADRTLPPDVAKIGLRTVSSSGREEPELTAALTKAGGITTGPRVLTPEEMQQTIAEVREAGDAARGEAIYRREALTCLKCHAIGGAGGRVGPDLASIGASAQVDYLIESLLLPDKAVKENYHTLVVATTDGRVHTGIKLRQTDKELILRTVEDRDISIPLESIEEQATGASTMPAGLTEQLTQQEFVDLVRFLSELGRTTRYSVGQDRVVRRWRVMDSTPEASYRLRRTHYGTAATDDSAYTWSSAYSMVDGTLPLGDLPEVRVRNRVAAGQRDMAFVYCELDVTTAGQCKIALNSIEGLQMWLGADPLTVAPEIELNLTTGIHKVTLAVDLSQRKDGLRVELLDQPGSQIQVQIVGGK